MAHPALANLQATLNRFASAADFSPLVIDGGMGSNTELATQNALVFACERGVLNGLGFEPPQVVTQARSNACNLRLKMDDTFASGGGQTFIMQNISALDLALTGVANELGLKAAAIVAPKPNVALNTFTPNKSAFAVTPPPSMGTLDKARLWMRQQPTAIQAGLGVGGGLALLIAFSKFKASKKKSKPVAGLRRSR